MSLDYLIVGFLQRSLLLLFLALIYCQNYQYSSHLKTACVLDCTISIKGELYAIRV